MVFRFLIRCANLEAHNEEQENRDYKVVNTLANSFTDHFEV